MQFRTTPSIYFSGDLVVQSLVFYSYTQYTYIIGKYKIYFYEIYKQVEKRVYSAISKQLPIV